MSDVLTVLIAIGSSTVVASIVANALQARRERSAARWEMKRQACGRALDLVDAIYANRQWTSSDGTQLPISPQDPPSIAEVRRCFNELTVACDRPQVSHAFRRCLGLGNSSQGFSADDIVDLRSAIRKELGFGVAVDSDREESFFGVISGTKESERTVETGGAE